MLQRFMKKYNFGDAKEALVSKKNRFFWDCSIWNFASFFAPSQVSKVFEIVLSYLVSWSKLARSPIKDVFYRIQLFLHLNVRYQD